MKVIRLVVKSGGLQKCDSRPETESSAYLQPTNVEGTRKCSMFIKMNSENIVPCELTGGKENSHHVTAIEKLSTCEIVTAKFVDVRINTICE